MTDSNGVPEGTSVAVILHERRGYWARQLRPRLQDLPVRWFETRSAAELAGAIDGLAAPVVLIELGNDPTRPLEDLAEVVARAPSIRALVIDPAAAEGVKEMARELGATHVVSGFAAPPEVAGWIARWVKLAAVEADGGGWSRPLPVDPAKHPREWIESLIAEAENVPAPTQAVEPPSVDS